MHPRSRAVRPREEPQRVVEMGLKFPRGFTGGSRTSGWDVLEYEAVQEKVGNVARMGRRLESALAALAAFDAARPECVPPADAAERERRVAEAGEALWYYVVQREACGLRGTEAVIREMGVPREVRLRMGLATRSRG